VKHRINCHPKRIALYCSVVFLTVAGAALRAQTVTTTVPAGTGPSALAVNHPVTGKIYVANNVRGNVTVIDGATNSTTAVTVGNTPLGVAVNPAANQIYVANSNSDNLTIINGATNSTTTVPSPFRCSQACTGAPVPVEEFMQPFERMRFSVVKLVRAVCPARRGGHIRSVHGRPVAGVHGGRRLSRLATRRQGAILTSIPW
jgi:YVTN family beta-propeller protein